MWDDQIFLVENNSIKKISNLPSFFYDARTVSAKSSWTTIYRPLRTAWYAIEYRVWGLNSGGYHFTSILIHGVNAAAVFYLGLALSLGAGPSALGASIFALHPVNTEAASWISARADLMMALFFIIAFLLHLKEYGSARRSKSGALLPGLFLSLSLLSKETAAVFPLITLVYHLAAGGKLRGQSFRKYLRLNIPVAAIVVIYIVLSRLIMGHITGYDFIGGSWPAAAAIMMRGFAYYITMAFFPLALSADYSSIARAAPSFDLRGPASSLIIAVAVSAVALAWRRSKIASFLALWFAIALAPASNLVVPLNFPIADRWLYLPMVGFSLLFGLALWRIGTCEAWRRQGVKKIVWACLAGILMFNMGLLAERRTNVWLNGATLWADVGKRWPLSPHAHNNLGNSYLDKGDTARARAHYILAAELAPYLPEPPYNLGNLYLISGQHDRAVAEYKSALLIEPDHAKALIGLAQAMWQLGYLERAIFMNSIAIGTNPRSSVARNNLGSALERRGYIDGAINNYRKAIEIDPELARAMSNLGDLYSRKGLAEEAESVLRKAIEIQPGLVKAHNNLGAVYGKRGDYDKAIAELKRAMMLNPGFTLARKNLGVALKSRGLFDMALREFELAVALAPGDAYARLSLGEVFLSLGSKEKALFEISHALRIDSKVATSVLAKGLIEKIDPEARVRRLIKEH